MFSKSKINEPGPKAADTARQPAQSATPSEKTRSDSSAGSDYKPATTPKAKPPASTLSSDLTVNGNLKTTGDVNVEGTVEGDIRAHLLTIGEGATVRGEVIADDVVINGRIIGRVRGLKVRLTSTARVEGDIIHKTIAIESRCPFRGIGPASGRSPQRQGLHGRRWRDRKETGPGRSTATAKAAARRGRREILTRPGADT